MTRVAARRNAGTSSPVPSWNRLPKANPAHIVEIADRFAALANAAAGTRCIAYGSGRSYGDVCLNDGGTVLRTLRLDHFIAFDRATGRLKCEAGMQLAAILDLVVPMGWFLPVTPGTRFVTVGGAVANDVHGKNHHVAGSFGNHVTALELVRSNGERIVCGPDREPEWFAATVGGLGLTGLITWVELALIPISNPFMVTEALRFRSLEEFWAMNSEAEREWPYTVSWIDCTSKRGRGVLSTSAATRRRSRSFRPGGKSARASRWTRPSRSSTACRCAPSICSITIARCRGGARSPTTSPISIRSTRCENWNRIYGARGFFQYQCVLPRAAAVLGVAAMLEKIAQSGLGSFLAVLKTFGDRPSLGMLSFPRAGATLALDFANEGEATRSCSSGSTRSCARRAARSTPARTRACRRRCSGRAFPLRRLSAPTSIRNSRPGSGAASWSNQRHEQDRNLRGDVGDRDSLRAAMDR